MVEAEGALAEEDEEGGKVAGAGVGGACRLAVVDEITAGILFPPPIVLLATDPLLPQ